MRVLLRAACAVVLASLLASFATAGPTRKWTDASGKFTLKGTALAPGIYQLKLDEGNQVLLFLDNKTHVQVTGDAKRLPATYTVKGSRDAEVLRQLAQVMDGSKTQLEDLGKRYNAAGQAGKTDEMKAVEQEFFVIQGRNNARL